jgi:hypothetical protein
VKHDWTAARTLYVEGTVIEGTQTWPTLEEVATKLGITPARVRERAGKESWRDARDIYRAKVEQARQEKRSEVLALRGADFDSRVLAVAEAQMGMIVRRMNVLNEAKTADGKPIPASPGDLQKLGLALRTVHLVGRLALGEGDGSGLGASGQLPSPSAAGPRRVLVEIVRTGDGAHPGDPDA